MKTNRGNAAIAEAPEGTRMLELRAFAPTESRRIARKEGTNGIIYGVNVLRCGELEGHRLWTDQTLLQQVVELGNQDGVKSRFGHPGISSDGVGKLLARPKAFRIQGDKVLADLHFRKSASDTPSGDLAKYVMDVAEESPEDIGLSIASGRDLGAEQRFMAEHSDEDGQFQSPEEKNTHNYPHPRLKALRAVDVVDAGAGTPDGLFARGSATAAEADALFAYAFELTEDEPNVSEILGIHPKRAKDFLQNFLARKGLSVVKIKRESSVSASAAATDPPVPDRAAKTAGPVPSVRRKLAIGGEEMDTALQKVIAELPEDKQNVCGLALEQHVDKVSKEAIATAVAPLNEELGTLRAQKDSLDQKVQQLEAEVTELKAITERERLETSTTAKLNELISSGKYPESAREELKPLVAKLQRKEALAVEEAEKFADLRTPADTLTTLTASANEGDGATVREKAKDELRADLQRTGFMAKSGTNG